MKPNIYLYNGRWHVYAAGNPINGFLLMSNAYAYAKAIWSRNNARI